MKEIFISRPNWIPKEFEKGMEGFYNILKSSELNPRTIGQSDIPNESPLSEVISLMTKCQGTIVLGIPQIEVTGGNLKGNSIDQKLVLGTEWNHIEAALAYSISHPLLLIHHKNISRGIFDRGASNSFNHEVDMSDPSWSMSNTISGALSNWKSRLVKPSIQKETKENEKAPTLQWSMYKFEGEQGLYCPTCYVKDGLKIPCSRIDTRYYQCPNCNVKLS